MSEVVSLSNSVYDIEADMALKGRCDRVQPNSDCPWFLLSLLIESNTLDFVCETLQKFHVTV